MDIRRVMCSVVVLVLIWCGGARATDVRNLKGMYTCFKDDYKELSVLEGAVAWERGVIRNLYDYAHEQNHDYMTSLTGHALEREEKKITSSVVKLVRDWFFYSGRQGVATDFKVSNKKLKKKGDVLFSNQEFAEIIAQKVAELWVIKYFPMFIFDQIIEPTNDLLFGDAVLDGKRIVYLAALWQVCGADRNALKHYNNKVVERVNYLLFHQQSTFEQKIEELDNNILILEKKIADAQLNLAHKSTDLKLKKLKRQAEDALKKAKIDRDLYQSYSDKINDFNLKNSFLKPFPIVVEDCGEPFSSMVFQKSINDVNTIMADVTRYTAGQMLSAEQLEKLSFISLMPKDYPPEIPQQSRVKFKTAAFSDCMDHAMRLFINHVMYDAQFGQFVVPANMNVLPALRDFYASHVNVFGAGAIKVHEEFAALIANIPLVIYVNAIGESGSRGYVKLPQGLTAEQKNQMEHFFTSNGIKVVGDAVNVYEVDPLVRNVIMILNHFFNIGLFPNNQTLVDQYTSSTFIKDNLERAFSSFGTVESSEQLDAIESLSKLYVDDRSGEDLRLTVTLHKNDGVTYNVTMVVQLRQHGYLKSPRKEELILPFFQNPSDDHQYYFVDHHRSLVEIMLMPFSLAKIFYVKLQSLHFYTLMSLLSMPLHDHNSVGEIINSIEKFPSLGQAHILKLATEVNNQEPWLKISRLETWYQKLLVSSLKLPEMLKSLYKFVFESVFNRNQQNSAIGREFQELLESNKNDILFIITQVIEAAKVAVENGMNNGFELFNKLFEQAKTQSLEIQNQVFESALEGAKVAVENGMNEGFELFNKLFEQAKTQSPEMQNQVVESALEAAKVAVENGMKKGFELFNKLFEQAKIQSPEMQNQVVESVLEAAKVAVVSEDNSVRILAFSLFQILFQKERVNDGILQGALQAAQGAVKSEDDGIRESGLKLLQFLVQQECAGVDIFIGALQIAQDVMKSENYNIRKLGIILFQILFQKESVGDAILQGALQVVQDAMNNEFSFIQRSGCDLFKILLYHDSARDNIFTEALRVVQEMVKSEKKFIRKSGLSLFEILVKRRRRNDILQEALQAAQDAMKSDDDGIKGLGFKLAAQAASNV